MRKWSRNKGTRKEWWEMDIKMGEGYKVRGKIAKRKGIFENVIALNEGGNSGFHALAALRTPKGIDGKGQFIIHEKLVIKYKDIEPKTNHK